MIAGPAGAGKTTLARSWLSSAPHPWSWLSVERALGEPDVFWSAVVRAMQRAAPDLVLDAADALDSQRDEGAIPETLVDDLAHVDIDGAPIVLAVDDAHLLAADTWRDLEWLIAHQPPALHLLLMSRSDPPFSVARMRALGWYADVRAGDLALSRAETREMLAQLEFAGVDDALAEAVFARTEGWAAGIRLSMIALQQGADPVRLLTAHDMASGMVSELLIAEALDQQPVDVRRFLRLTSVAPVLDPQLCQALTDRADSRTVLQQLARDQVFVAPLEGEREQYRFHPLFADVLRLELRAAGPDAERNQHQRAAAWFAAQGQYFAATEHALAGRCFEAAFDLIIAHVGELYAAGHRRAIGRWLLDFPDEFVVEDPKRTVDYCAALLLVVRPEWMPWWRRADALIGPDRPDLRARLDLLGAMRWGGQGFLERFEQHVTAARARRPAGTTEPWDELIDAWHARLLALHGDVVAAVKLARDVYERNRVLVRDLPARSLVAALLTAADEPGAEAEVADVVAEWRAQGEPEFTGMADVLTAGSQIALRRGDLEEAELLASAAVEIAGERPTHLLGVQAEIALADVEAALGDLGRARSRLGELGARMAAANADGAVLTLIDRSQVRLGPGAPTGTRTATATSLPEPLTERELTILGFLAGHRSFPEIGRELFISRHTVKTHVSRIYRKLGVSGRSDAVRAAGRHGLIPGHVAGLDRTTPASDRR